MSPSLRQLVPYFGALVGVTPIVAPIDHLEALYEGARLTITAKPQTAEPCASDGACAQGASMRLPCPECPTLEIEPQYRCNNPPWFSKCTMDEGGNRYRDKRRRWKWKCPGTTYVSCGTWNAIGCCETYDGGQSCAGNSGLVPCEGIPPQ